MKVKTFLIILAAFLFLIAPVSFTEEPAGVGSASSPAKSYGDGNLKVSMDFENAALKDVLKAFSRQTSINFIASNAIENKIVTVYLNNVSVEEALSSILDANDLAYERQKGNVYLIKSAGVTTVKTITRVYKLNYIQVYDMSQGADEEGISSISAATVYATKTQPNINISTAPGAAAPTQPPQVSGEAPRDIITIIRNILSPYGRVTTDRRTNSIIVTDVPKNFEAIEKTIKELDIEPIQVLIQAEIIETTTDAVKRIGIEYGTSSSLGTVYYGKGGSSGTGQKTVIPTPLPFPQSFIKDAFQTTLAASSLFKYGTITADDVQVVLKLFAEDEDTKFLSKPRIMTVNNERAVINALENTAIGTESTSVTDTGTTISTAERSRTGVRLIVTPHVNEKNDIFMFIQPYIARAEASTFFSTTYMDPKERSSSSTVMVRDGDTVVIAGLIKTDNYKTIRKVPILGDIPILGAPFRSKYRKVEDTEILIFVTPHIVKKRGDQYIIPDAVLDRERMIEEVLGKYDKKEKDEDEAMDMAIQEHQKRKKKKAGWAVWQK